VVGVSIPVLRLVANPPKPENGTQSKGSAQKKAKTGIMTSAKAATATMTLQDVFDYYYIGGAAVDRKCLWCDGTSALMKNVMQRHPPKVLYVAICQGNYCDNNRKPRQKAKTIITNLTSNVVLPCLGGGSAVYALTVTVRHTGKGVDGGHYVADVRDVPQIYGGARDDNVNTEQCGGWSMDNEKVSRLEKFPTEMEGLVVAALRRIDFPVHWRLDGTPAFLTPGPSALSSPIASSPLQSVSASLPIKAAEVPAAPIVGGAVVTKQDKKRRSSKSNSGQFAPQSGKKKKWVP
jgi:hypothetical protein